MSAPVRAAAMLLLACSLQSSVYAQGSTPSVQRLVTEADEALRTGRYGDALAGFADASARAPRDASLRMGAGLAAAMMGRYADARTWLEGALALNPRLADAWLMLGQMLHREGHVAAAVEMLGQGLQHVPGDKRLQAQADEWRRETRTEERFYRADGAHFTVLFEGPADDALARRAVEILEAAYRDVGQALSTYPSRSVEVVLYTREQFRDVTRAPSWGAGVYDGRIKVPVRGALEQPADLERVLKHEYVHAVVASLSGPALPAWVNEGLATVLEPGGLEWSEQYLARVPGRVSLARLQRGFGGLSPAQASIAYALSAVAVKRMMDLRGAPALVTLMQAVGQGTPFETAFGQTIYMRFEEFDALMSRY